jgi:carboxyl-terminal processing protease
MSKKSILTSILLIFITLFSANAQNFNNLDFKQLCDTSKTGLCFWDLSWGAKGVVSPVAEKNQSLLLIQGKTENSVGFTEQSASFASSGNIKILTITAFVKSDSIAGKGAGLNIGLYSKNGNLIASKDMGGLYSLDWIRGTNNWKKYTVSIVCPLETEKIKVGMILFGKGKAWFRDYKVSLLSLADRKPSKLAEQYINAACDTIKMNSLVKDSININELKATALKIAGPAKTYPDCYLAVSYLLESLRNFGDYHSFFMTAKEVENWKTEGSQITKIQFPTSKIIDDCGYITIPAFHGGNQKQILAFADSVQSTIKQLSLKGIKGWIIDLRQNTGGNMGPMIAGLGPLYSSEKLGSVVNVNGKFNSWYYTNGKYSWDDDTTGWSVTNPVKLSTKLPIAVLTSNQTGSSGEAVVVSFIGNDKTKSFGQPTWGLTTGNGSFDLQDGSQIYLASTVMADRNKKQYTGSINPDVVIDPKETGQEAITSAVKWITSQK